MNAVLDNVLVAAVLLASVAYALAKLGPRTLRRRILQHLSRILTAAPPVLGLQGVAQRLAAASGKAQAACGGCDTCGTESSSVPQSPSEVNVPVAKIGRRI
ncbi:MAG TPA: DUF6587 family protein [Steroidobacteraceae bacterium]|jgi:hypothetical protein